MPMQVTRINPKAERYVCEAEEVIFSGEAIDLLNRKITIDINSTNLNLRTIHDTQYPVITDPTGITVECIINEGVSVSSVSSTLVAFEIGDWPHLPTIIIRIRGRIQGAGGRGGWATNPDAKGTDGGTALRTRVAIQLDNTGGELWGGGGGGGGLTGGTGGGGGAGNIPGQGGASYPNTGPTGTSGTTEAAGLGYTTTVSTEDGRSYSAGNGGGPGLAGVDASSSPPGGTIFPTRPGGAAGKAIDGDSYVTVLALGDLRGQRTG